mmetsp:Transcript_13482/g.38861  ORF Transcript_13482/g.38861 Transcript_13482/m.38861 type:complete len:210 (+) Transcript_13482:484-1113(+)
MPRLSAGHRVVGVRLQVRDPLVVPQQPAGQAHFVDGHTNDVQQHPRGHDRVVAVHRRPLQQLIGRRLGRQGDRRRRIHDQIQPQEVQHRQGGLFVGHGADDVDGEDRTIHGELELQEFLNAVEDVPPPLRRHNDTGEVVVEQDDVRGVLGDLRACDPHGEADIRRLERWSVVRAVAGHRHNLSVRENDYVVVPRQLCALRGVFEDLASV